MWDLATVDNMVFSLEARFDGSGCWSLPSVGDEETVTVSLCSLYLRQGRQDTKCPSLSRCSVLLGRTYLGQGCSGARALGGHGEHSGDAQAHTGGCSIHVDPEGNPREDDNEQAGNVHLDQVVAHLSLQVEPGLNAGEFTCKKAE